MSYTVFVDDNGAYMDADARYTAGKYGSLDAAIEACRNIVDRSLEGLHKPGMSAESLSAEYKAWGDDPWISGADVDAGNLPFSAWDYALERSKEICAA